MTVPAAVMLFTSALCLLCALRPGHRGALAGAAIMAASMVDLTLGLGLISATLWAVALLATGVLSGIAGRGGTQSPHSPGALHRSLSLILMAALVIAGHSGGMGAAIPGSAHAHGIGAGTLAVVLGVAVAAVSVAALWHGVGAGRRRSPGSAAETLDMLSMSAMLVVMALPAA